MAGKVKGKEIGRESRFRAKEEAVKNIKIFRCTVWWEAERKEHQRGRWGRL